MAGCGRKTIRRLQARGLIARPLTSRGPSYDIEVVRRVRAILTLQAGGLTLTRIQSILAVRDGGVGPGPIAAATFDVISDAARRLTERIAVLSRTRHDLIQARESLARCRGCTRSEEACAACVEEGQLDPLGQVILLAR